MAFAGGKDERAGVGHVGYGPVEREEAGVNEREEKRGVKRGIVLIGDSNKRNILADGNSCRLV